MNFLKEKAGWAFFLLVLIALGFSSCTRTQEKPNILLVTIDTLRQDHLRVYGYPRETTPFIDGLAKNGLRFTQAVTPVPVTAGSHASILTSLHPLTHRCIKNGSPLPQTFQTIAEVLKENGYYTIGATAVNFLSPKMHFDQGFDLFSPVKTWKRNADDVNKSLLRQVDGYLAGHKHQPLFIWVHYYDPHAPYLDREFTFKESLPRRYDGVSPRYRTEIHRYDTEIRYTDDAVKEVMGYLESHGLTKKLVTCITADHGEQHGEHGAMAAHYDFYTENTRVPLIFHGWKIPRDKVAEGFVSTMDIAETLVHTAGLAFSRKTEGIDLLAGKNSRPDRPFLIIGNPWDIKSLQLIRQSLAYILNFDRYYNYWYVTVKDVVPGDRLKKIAKENLKITRKKNLIRLDVDFPNRCGEGLHYAVVKLEFGGNPAANKSPKPAEKARILATPGTANIVDLRKPQHTKSFPGAQGPAARGAYENHLASDSSEPYHHSSFITHHSTSRPLAAGGIKSTLGVATPFKTRVDVVFNHRLKTGFVTGERTRYLSVFHPVTCQDIAELRISFTLAPGTRLKKMEYALLTAEEIAPYTQGLTKLENKIHDALHTERRGFDTDEFYSLASDPGMKENLLREGGSRAYRDKSVEYRESVYRWYDYYSRKGEKWLGKSKKRVLTPEQVEMLKSLGYL